MRTTYRTLTALGWALVLLGSAASAGTFTWTGSAGTTGWGDKRLVEEGPPPVYVNNWGRYGNPPAFPQPGDDVVIGPGYVVVQNHSANEVVHVLTLGGGATLTLGNDRGLTLQADSPVDGTIRLADSIYGGAADLRIEGPVSLTGTGGVAFVSNNQNRIRGGTPRPF